MFQAVIILRKKERVTKSEFQQSYFECPEQRVYSVDVDLCVYANISCNWCHIKF